jgi:hypothetical protein
LNLILSTQNFETKVRGYLIHKKTHVIGRSLLFWYSSAKLEGEVDFRGDYKAAGFEHAFSSLN